MATSAKSSERDIYLPEPATVVRAEQMTAQEMFFEFKPEAGDGLGYMPGQFMQITVPGVGEAPISISSSPTGGDATFEMVVRKAGNVTAALHAMEPGDKVGIRGPFGTTFPVDSAMKGRDILFICGGIGLVPVRSAIHYVFHNRDDYGNVTILFGARSPAERLFTDELAEWTARDDVTFLETVDKGDEGWTGNVGVITTLMPDLDINPADTVAVICGPPVMYKFVIFELNQKEMPTDQVYVSLERHMKCGVGKCGHCQVNGLYVCQDGPVFRYADVEDVREAIQ
jgi:NAD(P)H-flavin reductase